MRKLLFAFLLPLVLLLSQQGAVTHEIGHIADFVERAGGGGLNAGAQPGAFDPVAHDPAAHDPASHRFGDLQCEACLAFAHLAGAVITSVLPPALLSFGVHFAVTRTPSFIAADAPVARSRGPPVFL